MILWFYDSMNGEFYQQIQNTKYAAEKDAKNQDTVAG